MHESTFEKGIIHFFMRYEAGVFKSVMSLQMSAVSINATYSCNRNLHIVCIRPQAKIT